MGRSAAARRIADRQQKIRQQQQKSLNTPIGQRATQNGKPVIWAGIDYGWQSPGSYQQLETNGDLRLGSSALRRGAQNIGNVIPEPVKQLGQWWGGKLAEKQEKQRTELQQIQNPHLKQALLAKGGHIETNATRSMEWLSKQTNIAQPILETGVALLEAGVEGKIGLDSVVEAVVSPRRVARSVGAAANRRNGITPPVFKSDDALREESVSRVRRSLGDNQSRVVKPGTLEIASGEVPQVGGNRIGMTRQVPEPKVEPPKPLSGKEFLQQLEENHPERFESLFRRYPTSIREGGAPVLTKDQVRDFIAKLTPDQMAKEAFTHEKMPISDRIKMKNAVDFINKGKEVVNIPDETTQARNTRIRKRLQAQADASGDPAQVVARTKGGVRLFDWTLPGEQPRLHRSTSDRPVAPIQSTRKRINGEPLPDKAPGIPVADRRPKKGTPPTRVEQRIIKQKEQTLEGRRLTSAETTELNRIKRETPLKDRVERGFGGRHTRAEANRVSKAAVRERAAKEGIDITDLKEEAKLANVMHEEKQNILKQHTRNTERIEELERIQLGSNNVRTGGHNIKERIHKRHKDWDPKAVGEKEATQNVVSDLERNADVERITPATRRRMSKESQGRIERRGFIQSRHPRRMQSIDREILRDRKPFEFLSATERKELAEKFKIDTSNDTFPEHTSWGPGSAERLANHHDAATPWEFELFEKYVAETQKILDDAKGPMFGPNDTKNKPSPARVKQRIKDKQVRGSNRTKRYEAEYAKEFPFEDYLEKAREELTEEFLADRTKHEVEVHVRRHARALREADYAAKYGLHNDRLTKPSAPRRTENAAGKESIKQQFRDARTRRGVPDASDLLRRRAEGEVIEIPMTGDTRFRGRTPSKVDSVGRPLNGRVRTKLDDSVRDLNKGKKQPELPKSIDTKGGPRKANSPTDQQRKRRIRRARGRGRARR